MEWNAGPIYTALIIAIILYIYSKEESGIRSIQNQLFRISLVTEIFSMATLLVSIVLSANIGKYPLVLIEFFNVLSRILITVIAPLFFYYTVTIIWQNKDVLKKWIFASAWLYFLFALLLISSPFNGLIYYISDANEVAQGPLYNLMYAIPTAYLALITIVTIFMRNQLSRDLKFVIFSFPLLCLLLLTVEYFYHHLLISSTAATASLVITYLYIQNKKILEDDLTGTMNRRAFSKVVSMNLEENTKFKIVLISLNEFKNINRQFGEEIGDQLLKYFAHFLLSLQSDTHVFRFSGDEFAVLTKNNNQNFYIQAIQSRLLNHWVVQEKVLMVGATIVELTIPEITNTLESIINVLEYSARNEKKLHKGNYVVVDQASLQSMQRRDEILELLKDVIKNRDLEVVYQPIFNVESGRYEVFEALARLNSKELGAISPLEFIEIAEEKGLINELGKVLIEQVCKTIKLLNVNGVHFKTIQINISAIQMKNAKLVNEVATIAQQQQVDMKHLHIEVTESVVIEKFAAINEVMMEFEKLGIQFSLDDYGTGYSNLESIIHLPFTAIKLDKSLLYRATTNQSMLTVIQALSRSFKEIGKMRVIEGVETLEHVTLAKTIGCDYLQGYYFAKPMNATSLLIFLKEHNE